MAHLTARYIIASVPGLDTNGASVLLPGAPAAGQPAGRAALSPLGECVPDARFELDLELLACRLASV